MVALLALPGIVKAAYVPGHGSGIEQALRDYLLSIEAAGGPGLSAPIQYGAPSSNPASPCLLDRAESAGPLATTLDRAVRDVDGAEAITLGVGPSTLGSDRSPEVARPPAGDALRRALHRTAIHLTLGGPTQRLESARDGRRLDLGDHATVEVKLRVIGSRDRGDHRGGFQPTLDVEHPEGALQALVNSTEYRPRLGTGPDEPADYQAFAAALRGHPAWAGALVAEHPDLTEAARAFSRRVERSFLLGLSLTADTYGTGFGRDLYTATLIGELASPVPLTLNAGFRAEEEVHETRNWESKVGLGTGRRWRRGPLGPLELTVAACALVRNHDRPSVWLGSLKLDTSLSRNLTLTGALIRSDRPERLGVGSSRGYVGVTYRILGGAR